MQKRDTGALQRKEDMRALKLYIYAGLGFGEHYMGDPASGNLATATAMELPVLKMIQAEQKFWASIYTDLTDFAIDVAVIGGKLPGTLLDQDELEVKTVDNRSFTIHFPPITQQLTGDEMAALATGVTNRLIPESTAARLAMELFEVDDIDEALEELFDDKEVQAAVEKLKAQLATQAAASDPNMSPEAQAAALAANNNGGALPPGTTPYVPTGSGGGNGNGGSAQ
jgi:hypothetical protein